MNNEINSRCLVDIIKQQADSEKLHLPVFPEAALELQRLLADDDASMDKIATVVGRDQALASHLLRTANTTFFSGLKKVTTIKEAVMRLGTQQVFNCLVFASQQNAYRSRDGIIGGHLRKLWEHAVGVSLGSKWLLEKIGYRELRDSGFLAGLLRFWNRWGDKVGKVPQFRSDNLEVRNQNAECRSSEEQR